ncbi:hypothetical protein ACOBQX_00855 [Actinokineospora sp. G85]|uniref:hypothetical protein n=1 Tax=Actinokineospora sp. G85 TaxID=3406626 RepID=UPI003C7441A7
MPDLSRPVSWRPTGVAVVDHAVRVDGQWWVLRVNDFPDHPLRTLFVGRTAVLDFDEPPAAWDLGAGEPLDERELDEVLDLMRGLGPYGSEVGQPCEGYPCGCDRLTDDRIRASRRRSDSTRAASALR